MIRHITAHSVNEALYNGLYHLAHTGLESGSRNGGVIVSPYPVVTTYVRPRNRVLVSPRRDANPFFHLFESLWMLAGRNDVAFPAKFAGNIANYSDDLVTLHGAYGYRWRKHFGYDQLEVLIEHLRHDPSTRRAVLQMWDASLDDEIIFGDLEVGQRGGKDVPCNTAAYFDTVNGLLNMTVTCRSNDVIWGAYGANAVHFSFLLEYMALRTGIPMGVYRQFSNNFHIYADLVTRGQMPSYAESVIATDVYGESTGIRGIHDYDASRIFSPPLFGSGQERMFEEDLIAFMQDVDADNALYDYQTDFFTRVVIPMYRVWTKWKAKEYEEARHLSLMIYADDWRAAAQSWLSVREQRRAEKENANV